MHITLSIPQQWPAELVDPGRDGPPGREGLSTRVPAVPPNAGPILPYRSPPRQRSRTPRQVDPQALGGGAVSDSPEKGGGKGKGGKDEGDVKGKGVVPGPKAGISKGLKGKGLDKGSGKASDKGTSKPSDKGQVKRHR